MMTLRHFTRAIFLLAAFGAIRVLGQYGWPVTPFDSSHLITGTFCEYRDTMNSPHFHNGVDIPKADGSPVYAVQDGTVTSIQRTGGNAYVRVGNFAYVHINPSPSLTVGSHVTAFHTVIGTILPGAGHVHFIDGYYNEERNALRSGGGLIPYNDPWAPVIRYVRFYPDGATQPFSGSAISGRVDLVVKVDEQNGSPTSSLSCRNNGTFELGYDVLTSDTSTVLQRTGVRFRFMTKPSNRYVHNVFFKKLSSTTSHVYIPTNYISRNGWLDASELPVGPYLVRVWTRDTRANSDTLLLPFEVVLEDKTPPEAPELLYVRGATEGFDCRWQGNPDADLVGYRLWFSFDGDQWKQKFSEQQLPADCTRVHFGGTLRRPIFFRLTAVDNAPVPNESAPSDVYGMQQGRAPVLIVDAFHRTTDTGGAWPQISHDFALRYALALPEELRGTLGFDVCSDAAVTDSAIVLGDYTQVIVFTGDSGGAAPALRQDLQDKLSQWFESQETRTLVIFGANVASSLDSTTNPYAIPEQVRFLRRILHAAPSGRHPNSGLLISGPNIPGFSLSTELDGTDFQPDSLDILTPLAGAQSLLLYAPGNKTAAVIWTSGNHRTVLSAVPLPAIADADSQRAILTAALGLAPAGVETDRHAIGPTSFSVSPAYPNPFNSSVQIRITIPRAGRLQAAVYDIRGRLVESLADNQVGSGVLRLTWSGRSSQGKACPSGIYLFRAMWNQSVQIRRLLLLR